MLRVEDEVIYIDDSDSGDGATRDLLENLWEKQLNYAIGCTVKIQSRVCANQWLDGTIFHNPISGQSYAVRLGLSPRVELKVAESRIKFRKVDLEEAYLSLGDSETQKPLARKRTMSETKSERPSTVRKRKQIKSMSRYHLTTARRHLNKCIEKNAYRSQRERTKKREKLLLASPRTDNVRNRQQDTINWNL